MQRFEELLERWQEGDASAAELAELEALLRDDPQLRRTLVGSMLVEVHLQKRYAPAEAPAREPGIRGWWTRKRRMFEVAAALALVAISAYALFRPAPVVPRPDAPIAPPFTLSDAIDLALLKAPGTVIKAEFEVEDGKSLLVVEIAQGDKVREVVLDGRTKAVVSEETENEDRSSLVRKAAISVPAAIERALKEVPGEVVGAELESEDGRTIIEVKIRRGGSSRKVKIDARTGEVLRK